MTIRKSSSASAHFHPNSPTEHGHSPPKLMGHVKGSSLGKLANPLSHPISVTHSSRIQVFGLSVDRPIYLTRQSNQHQRKFRAGYPGTARYDGEHRLFEQIPAVPPARQGKERRYA